MKQNLIKIIHQIRGHYVIVDNDLAKLYCVETKVLNQAVRRNKLRFPKDFMFKLTQTETKSLKSQFVTSKSTRGGRRYLPNVFTEQGVAMLSGILKSQKAIDINIQVMRAFVNMRTFLLKNAEIFQKITKNEKKIIEQDEKIKKIFSLIENKQIKPEKGIFFEGQIFDAYSFISDIIRTANNSIVLIDNYVDDTVLTLFTKRKKNIKVEIYTHQISNELKLDLKKYNSQYPNIEIKKFKKSHDRFLIIDENDVYHIGASLKDLGKKWFACSKFDGKALRLLKKLT